MTSDENVDARLLNWNSIKEGFEWCGLLVGNGSSLAIWDGFGYESLLQEASEGRIPHPLTEPDITIFRHLKTENFEKVLRALSISAAVNEALDLPKVRVRKHYRSIRQALIEALHAVHVEWSDISPRTFTKIRGALGTHEFIFSTNYDLIIYWAMMSKDKGWGFADYMWHQPFNPGRTGDAWDDVTKVLYLHGGLHLYRRPDGGTIKRRAAARNLLSLFGKPYHGAVPLFVSEASAGDKLAAIHRSDYLSFAYNTFSTYEHRLVIFGQALGVQDRHLIASIRRWGNRRIAVSLCRKSKARIMAEKIRFKQLLPKAKLIFFDAATHPLGDPSFHVD